jgi:hypothetical protein
MKHAFHWKRAVLVVAALTLAGEARALGGQSGVGGNGTGGPQVVHQGTSAAEAPKTSPTGLHGVPTWYSVDGISRAQPARDATPVVDRSQPVPHWYAIS